MTWTPRVRIRLDPAAYREPGRVFSITVATSPRADVFTDLAFGLKCVAILREMSDIHRNRVYACCLMPDHAHLLLESLGDSPVDRFVGMWKGRCYASRRRSGLPEPFWQRSFFDRAVRSDEDLRAAAQYMLDNPVRRGIVDRSEAYPLSGSFVFELVDEGRR